jgi:DNA recombination protein RmuC
MEYLIYAAFLAAGLLAGWVLAVRKSAALQSECAVLRAQAEEKERTAAAGQSALEGAQRKLDDLMSAHTAAQSDVSALRAQMAEREHALSSRQVEFDALKRKLDETTQAHAAAQADAAALRAKLIEVERAHVDKLKDLADAQARLSESFKALASDALRANNAQFMELAKTTLEAAQKAATGELEKRAAAVETLVTPIRESLEKVDKHIGEMEKERVSAYSGLTEQVKQLGVAQTQLQSETAQLVRALRAPQTRGRWGEITLRRVVEMAGMSEHCDFEEQVSVDNDGTRLRPDLVVKLPGGRVIVVDAKVSLKSYLDALEAQDDVSRAALLVDHARQVKDHVTRLGAKSYFEQFEKTPDFVVAFLPGDPFLGAAFEKDPALLEYGAERKVLIATPATLIALLKAVAYGWRQESVEENAQKISDLGKELYDRIAKLAEHLAGVGNALDKAVKSYNDAVGSLETRVLVTTRKFRELNAAGGKEIAEAESVERAVRAIQAPELTSQTEGPA